MAKAPEKDNAIPAKVNSEHLQENGKLLNDPQIEKVQRYFEANTEVNKISRKEAKKKLGIALNFSVLKLDDGKLVALYQGKARQAKGFKTEKALGAGAFGSVKLGQMLTGNKAGKWVAIKSQRFEVLPTQSEKNIKEIRRKFDKVESETDRKIQKINQQMNEIQKKDPSRKDPKLNKELENLNTKKQQLLLKQDYRWEAFKIADEKQTKDIQQWKDNIKQEEKALGIVQSFHGSAQRESNANNEKLKNVVSYSAMELYNGKEIYDITKSNLTESEKLKIQLSALESLKSFHAKNMIHRDIKPENIIWDEESKKCKLIDFGLAVELDQNGKFQESGETKGSPGYIPDEVVTKGSEVKTYSKMTDNYAIGFVLSSIETGGEISNDTIVSRASKQDRERLKGLESKLPDYIKGLTNKDPNQRWTLEQAIETVKKRQIDLKNDKPIENQKETAPSPPWKPASPSKKIQNSIGETSGTMNWKPTSPSNKPQDVSQNTSSPPKEMLFSYSRIKKTGENIIQNQKKEPEPTKPWVTTRPKKP